MIALLALAAYVFTPVTVPNGTIYNFFAPNDKGQIPLTTTVGSGIWQNGNFTLLPNPPNGIVAFAPTGINNDGTVVGFAIDADNHEEGFILIDSTYTFLSRPGWANTEPRFISTSGLITGYNFDDTGTVFAGFVYDPVTGQFTDATPTGSDAVIVQGMNKYGVVSGSGHDPALGDYGFTWQLKNFGQGARVAYFERFTLENQPSRVRGINDAGVIVGYTADGKTGFVGNAVVGYRLLHLPGQTGDSKTVCEGVNNLGQVTCAYYNANNITYVFLGTAQP